jgi:hypothetical protein
VFKGFAGVLEGDEWWGAANALETLIDSISDVDTAGTFTVEEPGGDTSVSVYAVGGLQIARVGQLSALPTGKIICGFNFQVALLAADPTKTVTP